MTHKVLISDKLSPLAVEIFEKAGLDVDYKPGLSKEELIDIIGEYDALAIRSNTKVTEKVLAHATKLKVVGRAGIGVDNVDIPKATAAGVIVMNTPFGNSITTAEHAIALMFALARELPQANESTHKGEWAKSKFMGVELTSKTLGLIGCGNIGSIVASRALGLKMKVVAFDPFLSPERALELGVDKVDLDTLLKRADFISLHTPLTEKTRNILNANAFTKMKDGVRIINCARGGLIDEVALANNIESGKVAGAALDVFETEPAKEHALFGNPKVICTPHLGASTSEAQENVALQVAEQMSDYLLTGAITNALNFPSISAEEAPILRPFVDLSDKLGLFAGQLTETSLKGIRIEYAGKVAELNTKALTSAMVNGVLLPITQSSNMISALSIAKDRGIQLEEVKRDAPSVYESYIRLSIITERQERSVAGTIFSDGKPRVIQIKGISLDAEFEPNMLYVTNLDKPGFIGNLGSLLGELGVNISTFALGRTGEGGDAIALVGIDSEASQDLVEKVNQIKNVVQCKALKF